MTRLVILIFISLIQLACISQSGIDTDSSGCIIGKDSALHIAFANGFERGLDTVKVTKVDDTIWRFECLVCDDNNTDRNDNMNINCVTGKVEPSTYFSETVYLYMGGSPRVYSEFAMDINNKPVMKLKSKPYMLAGFESGPESNISVSDKNQLVFAYGFRKIGIINLDGSGFKQICEECLYPQWINNDVVSYFKDFEHVYESDINSLTQTRITNEELRYDGYTISPDNRWLAYLKDNPHPEYDSEGNVMPNSQTCGDPREYDLWIMDILNPTIQKKVNRVSADIYDPTWSEKGDSLLFYNGDHKYFATDLEKDSITCTQLDRLSDIKLTNYKKMKNGIFPVIKDCKIVEADYSKRAVKDILINERGRYSECVLSNDQKYLIYTKSDKKLGDTKIWVLDLTK